MGVLVELGVLGAWLARSARTRLVRPLALYLASGVSLLLALRGALAHTGDAWIGVALLAGLASHLAFLVWLLRGRVGDPRIASGHGESARENL